MSASPLRPRSSLPPRRRLLAALAACAVAGSVALAGCSSDDEPGAEPASGDTSSSAASTPTDSPSDTGPVEPSGTGSTGDDVSVYFATEVTTGVRLVAEPTPSTSDDAVTDAANLALTAKPVDPDYRNLFAAVGADSDAPFTSVTVDESIGAIRAEIDGSDWSARPRGMSAQQAELAVQALVYTVQGAAASKLPFQVVDAEGNPTTLLGVDTSTGVKAASQLKVLSLVNVLSPVDGSTVDGTVEVSGLASSFEGTVRLQVLDPDGKAVFDNSAQGTFDPRKLTPWSRDLDVSGFEPGTYLLVASTDDPSGGTEGPGPNEDTKTLVVE